MSILPPALFFLVVSLLGTTVRVSAQSPWQPLNGQPAAFSVDSMFFDTALGEVVLYESISGDTRAWDGQGWRRVGSGGPVLQVVAVAYDEARSRGVLFDGAAGRTWEWNGVSWTVANTDIQMARQGAALAFDPTTGSVILHGGYVPSGGAVPTYLDGTWSWNGGRWTLLSRTGPAAALLNMTRDPATNGVLGFGGRSGILAGVSLTDTWTWDGVRWTQLQVPGPATGDGTLAGDTVRNRVVLSARNPALLGNGQTWEWDGAAWSLIDLGAGPLRFEFGNIAFDQARGETVAINAMGMWAWNGATWTARVAAPPDPGNYPIMVHAPNSGTTLLLNYDAVVPETWELNGSVWTLRATGAPATHRNTAAVHDLARDRTVLFGGSRPRQAVFNDRTTWEWDGTTWTQVATTGPAGRQEHAMAYDALRQQTLLFGGDVNGRSSNELWAWDGSQWSQIAATGPAPRRKPAMVYDPVRDRTVLFGGYDQAQLFGDTWEWDGSVWTQVASTGPSPRGSSSIAYDPVRRRTVLFSGSAPNDPMDTWEWDGVSWSRLVGADSPVPLVRGESLVFDTGRRRLISHSRAMGLRQLTWSSVGVGCAGAAGVPELELADDRPRLGTSASATVSSVPGGTVAILALGFDVLGSPNPLATLGMPGCDQLIVPQDVVVGGATPSGEAAWTVPIPNAPGLVGLPVMFQVVAVDRGANGAGLTTSNGQVLVLAN